MWKEPQVLPAVPYIDIFQHCIAALHRCLALHCIALHCIALPCSAVRCIVLHCITAGLPSCILARLLALFACLLAARLPAYLLAGLPGK